MEWLKCIMECNGRDVVPLDVASRKKFKAIGVLVFLLACVVEGWGAHTRPCFVMLNGAAS